MSLVDILDKLEKLEINSSTDEWMKIRKLRNKITHEYPDELKEIKEDMEIAITYFSEIENTLVNIKKYLKQRDLI